ncbi:MAG TPA: hypothetical protein VMM56_04955 [Planctomycetaceae bacterium]|nr:hypothetical protein [Planctomycetaceae bacterium]
MDEQLFDAELAHKYFAPRLNVECWSLIDQASRTEDENRRMLMTAFASCYHWLHAGNDVNQQRGEWLIAKVYAVLEDGPNCLKHARHCMAWTGKIEAGLNDFDRAYACEMLARGHALCGQIEQARDLKTEAQRLGDQIEDGEDRKIFLADLAWGNWNGVE